MKRVLIFFVFLCCLTCNAWSSGQDNNVDVQILARSSKSWDNQLLPKYPDGQPEVRILKITIPAGAKLPMHMHPVINAGVLLKGELTIRTKNGKTLHLKAGQAIVEVVNKWHYGKNQGQKPAEIIVFYAASKNLPISILKQQDENS